MGWVKSWIFYDFGGIYPPAPQKVVQMTNLYSSDSPCRCCGSLFKVHQCPTWSQIAVLLVNGAGQDTWAAEEHLKVSQRCEICLECFSSPGALVQHMQVTHGLQGLSFNPSRDALDNCPACSHCGLIMQTMSGLKTHIVQGKCPYFNPEATAETQPLDDLWKVRPVARAILEQQISPTSKRKPT